MRKISYLLIKILFSLVIFTSILYAQEEQVASRNPLISILMMIAIFVNIWLFLSVCYKTYKSYY